MLSAWYGKLPLLLQLSLTLCTLLLCVVASVPLYLIVRSLIRVINLHVLGIDIYANFPRTKHTSTRWWWLLGDLPEIVARPPSEPALDWQRELKSDVLVSRGMFYVPRVIFADVQAMNYILGQSKTYAYPKPVATRDFLVNMVGNGLLVAEGDVHKRQRRIIQPAFNVSAIRALTPLFFRHANAFVAKLGQLIDETKGPADVPFLEGQSVHCARFSQTHKPALDISHWFSRVTLDIIGEAGFGHQFNAVQLPLDKHIDSIVAGFNAMMKQLATTPIVDIVIIGLSRLPGFTWAQRIPTKHHRIIGAARRKLDKTSMEIILKKRREIMDEFSQGDGKAHFDKCEGSKDLLYLMMRANMSTDIRDSEKMSDVELLSQITTLLIAGHETASSLLSWFIHEVVKEKNKSVLQRLRAEIEDRFAGRDELEYDALMAMPYLDKCTKEILRFCSPVFSSEREVSEDDVVPLGKGCVGRDGKTIYTSVPVKKGDWLFIPIHLLHMSKDIWGETAHEFDPDRWDNVPQKAKDSGFPMHILSFLQGPRGCIGNRFALAEFKAIVCILLRSLDIQALEWTVERKQGIVVRPRVVGQEDVGMQLPVRISRL